jgi:hypothetical protein
VQKDLATKVTDRFWWNDVLAVVTSVVFVNLILDAKYVEFDSHCLSYAPIINFVICFFS